MIMKSIYNFILYKIKHLAKKLKIKIETYKYLLKIMYFLSNGNFDYFNFFNK